MTSETVPPLPASPTGVARLSLPDALRGFGLFGVLMINMLGLLPGHAVSALLVLTVASLWLGPRRCAARVGCASPLLAAPVARMPCASA
jgi:uncharacterized membrane protein YeiB